jgi:hypothetical protein
MSEEPDLVRLLYRADWTRLSLAAEVSASQDPSRDLGWLLGGVPPAPPPGTWPWSWPLGGSWATPFSGWPGESAVWDEPPGEPGSPGESREAPGESLWRRFGGSGRPPWAGHEWEMATDQPDSGPSRSTLLIAPGGRYRREDAGDMSGCDGTRSWHAVKENDGWSVVATGGPQPPPMASMLQPSWLLTGFTLETGGSLTVSGRDALRVTATPRPGRWNGPAAGRRRADRVEIIVDAGLGILLRHEEILDGSPLRVTEMTDIRIDSVPPGDDAWSPPGGWDGVEDDGPPFTANGPGWEVIKLTTGLAAAGFGALLKSSRFRPFEQATREEAEAEMPAFDGPMAADGPPVSDEVLHLLHASPDRWAPGIAATLHEWRDVAAMLAQAPDSARRAGFGGLGYLIDTAGERFATVHTISRLRLGSAGQYRIEPVLQTGPGRPGSKGGHPTETVICDGERRWRIGEDEVTVGPAAPPFEIPNMFDASWLLGRQLIGGQEVVTDGRRGYRLKGASDVKPPGGWLFFPDEIVVDAELGVLLRWISLAGEQPVTRYELRDVVVGPPEPGAFRPDIPPGVRVVEESRDQPPSEPVNLWGVAARQAAKEARSALRNVLGALRGEDTH